MILPNPSDPAISPSESPLQSLSAYSKGILGKMIALLQDLNFRCKPKQRTRRQTFWKGWTFQRCEGTSPFSLSSLGSTRKAMSKCFKFSSRCLQNSKSLSETVQSTTIEWISTSLFTLSAASFALLMSSAFPSRINEKPLRARNRQYSSFPLQSPMRAQAKCPYLSCNYLRSGTFGFAFKAHLARQQDVWATVYTPAAIAKLQNDPLIFQGVKLRAPSEGILGSLSQNLFAVSAKWIQNIRPIPI